MQFAWIRYSVKWLRLPNGKEWRTTTAEVDLQFIPRSLNSAQFFATNYYGALESDLTGIRVKTICYEIAAKSGIQVHLAEFKHDFTKLLYIRDALSVCSFEFVPLNILLETNVFGAINGVQFNG
jgi:hypothetical protein